MITTTTSREGDTKVITIRIEDANDISVSGCVRDMINVLQLYMAYQRRGLNSGTLKPTTWEDLA